MIAREIEAFLTSLCSSGELPYISPLLTAARPESYGRYPHSHCPFWRPLLPWDISHFVIFAATIMQRIRLVTICTVCNIYIWCSYTQPNDNQFGLLFNE